MVLSADLAKSYVELTAEQLLGTCVDLGNRDAWEELIRRFHPVVSCIVFRTGKRFRGFQYSLCDDLEQSVYLHLAADHAKVLRRFVPQASGCAFGYVQTIAKRVAHDRMKSKGFAFLGTGLDVPEIGQASRLDAIVFTNELKDFLRGVLSERDYRILLLHGEGGMTAGEIAAIASLGLSAAGVGSVLTRARDLVRKNFPDRQKEITD